ncbi:MAG: Long-chain-fatty-acid--CoA ligase [Alphaproteobacteria bacterium MarineAlpha2_Bin1]|nr:MAG: Long-chain-fatty-acid--CoA ligase [Alphaproteobacteria bacterium MarineAlpha2_Bin1]
MPINNLYSILFKDIKNYNNTIFEIPNKKEISYNDLEKIINNIYINLMNKKVVPGDRICVQTNKCIEVIALYLACLKIGAVYIPLNSDYSLNELEYFIEDSKPKLFIMDKQNKYINNVSLNEITKLTLLKELTIYNKKYSENQIKTKVFNANNHDIAAILYTSGTTGKPKGAVLSHKNLSSNCLSLKKIWEFSSKDTLLHALPVYHVHGLFVAINCSILSGSKIIFLPKFEIETVIEYIPKATVMMGVPTFYNRLIEKKNLDKNLCKNMRVFISGSAPLTRETWNIFHRKTGHKILERYGMTETGMISSNPYLTEQRKAESVGWPLPDVKVRISEEKYNLKDNIGEIEVRGPNVFNGYWNRENKKDDFTNDDFFKTGDLGKIDKEGRIYIVGRQKDLIITGGLNVYPKEVEDRLNEINEIKESAVVGIPNKDFGETVIAIVVLEKNQNLEPEEIQNIITDKLAKFKVPKKYFFLNELPRNIMGKIQKNILRNKYKNMK